MEADYDIFEIVTIIRDFWLVDAESYQRMYCTHHGVPLTPGFYIVNWPEHIRSRRFNEHAAFHGPFNLRQEAQSALDWMRKKHEQASMASEISSVTAPSLSPIQIKKAATPGRRLINGAKIKPRITRTQPPYYQKTATM